MTAQTSPATLAVCAFAVALAGFAGGVAVTKAFARPSETAPIVDPSAWNEIAPEQPVGSAQAAPPACNPWEISDVAMEAVLDQMIRRGWRAPTQGGAIAMLDRTDIEALAPGAPMPARNAGSPAQAVEHAHDQDEKDVAETAAPEPQPAEATRTEPPPA